VVRQIPQRLRLRLEVRAGSPLGKILGGPLKGLSDPAKL